MQRRRLNYQFMKKAIPDKSALAVLLGEIIETNTQKFYEICLFINLINYRRDNDETPFSIDLNDLSQIGFSFNGAPDLSPAKLSLKK